MPREFESFQALFVAMESDVHNRIKNAKPIMQSVGNLVQRHAQGQLGHYLDHGGPFPGEPWDPLAESTLKKKAHDTPLIETGELHDSIEVTATHSEVEIGVRSNIGARGVDIGDIAVWMEFGTLLSGGHTPPRPFLGPALQENTEDVLQMIAAGLFVEMSRRE